MQQSATEPTVSIFLHTYETPDALPRNEERRFGRIPCVGEYVILNENSGLYQVVLVEHYAFPDDDAADNIAEVWAVYAGTTADVREREIRGAKP